VITYAPTFQGSAPAGPKVAQIDWKTIRQNGPYYSSWLAPIPVTPGQTYCLDLWTQWTGVGLRYGIRRFDQDQIDLGRQNVLAATLEYEGERELGEPAHIDEDTGFWQHILKTFTVPAGTHHVQIFGTLESRFPDDFNDQTAALVDGVRLWRGACATGQEAPICAAADTARGLRGEYFDNADLTNPKLTRLDGPVAFTWATGSPDPLIGADTFAVRWTGFIEPRYTETHTFITRSDDGVRLYVNGVKVIENWTDHAATENTGTIALEAGKRVPVTLEYYENGGNAVIELSWQSARQAREFVPRSQLFPGAGGCTASGVLLAHFGLDEGSGVTVGDSTCNGNLGTLREYVSPPGAAWQAGRSGGALAFDGVSNWVRVPSSPSLNSVTAKNQLTVSAWVKQTAIQPGWATVASRQADASTGEHFGLTFLDGKLTFIVNSHEPGTHRCTAAAVAPVGEWIHVAGTFDGQTARAYLNGAEVCNFARAVALKSDTTPLILGGNANNASDDAQELLKGALDDVALHNRALSPAEVAAVAAGGACAVGGGPPELTTPGEVLAEEEGFSAQARVAYTVSAVDPGTGMSLVPSCTPAAGTSFPLGTATVTCTAAVGTRSAQATFKVRVYPRNRGNRVALLVVGNTALSPSDAVLRQQLEARGYDVVLRSGPAVTAADASGKALILISQSVSSGDVNTKLTNVRVPAVVLEPSLYDDMKLAGPTENTDYGNAAGQTQVEIAKPGHPLAGGLAGKITVTSSPQTLVWGKPAATAIKVATLVGSADQAAVFAYATGDAMVGLEAPGRRVGFFSGQDVAVALDETGKKLLDAAITWATQAEALLVVEDAAALRPSDVALRERLTELGYGVFIKKGPEVLAAHADGAEMVFLSESTFSPTVDGRLNAVRTPVVSAEPALWDDLGMVGSGWQVDFGDEPGQTRLDIVYPAHPMAAGLSGTVTVASAPGKFLWGKPAATAVAIATIDDQPGKVAVFGYPTGVFMVSATAPGRRAGLFMGRDVPATLTADGWKLVDAAIRWAAQPEVLFVVGSTAFNAADAAVEARLKALGFGVVARSGPAVTAADAAGMVGVVISESTTSGDVGARLRDVTTPVLSLEPFLYDDMQMCGPTAGTDYGDALSQTQLAIVDATHALAAGLAGTVTVVSPANKLVWGRPGASAAKVATIVGASDRAAIFGYRAGAAMVPLEAPARRVGWFGGQTTTGSLTADGQKLLDAAIKWTAAW
jgi:hypothetical protein